MVLTFLIRNVVFLGFANSHFLGWRFFGFWILSDFFKTIMGCLKFCLKFVRMAAIC
jgi:hypothetical protein